MIQVSTGSFILKTGCSKLALFASPSSFKRSVVLVNDTKQSGAVGMKTSSSQG